MSKKMSPLLWLMKSLLPGILLIFATPSKAFGYADPGTGAFLYQAVYAAFLGGAYYLRRFLDRFWRKRK